MARTQVQIALITSSLIGFLAATVAAGPQVVVGQQVRANQQVSIDQIDHSDWTKLLQTFVNERGEVNYQAWKNSKTGMQSLDRYLAKLSAANQAAKASRQTQLAYWINAYNAVTIKGILREYPTTSIRNHTAKLAGYNIWKDLLLIAGSKRVSLEQIEHDILRKMNEPRIHFAIVCASRSCPRLLKEAYTAERLEEQLVNNTKYFFASSENFRHDRSANRMHLSAIMKWFGKDFGPNRAAQLMAIAPYLPDEASRRVAANKRVSISYLSYDWSINEQKASLASGS